MERNEMEAWVQAEYIKGRTLRALADELGLSVPAIWQILRKHQSTMRDLYRRGIKRVLRRDRTPTPRDQEIYNLYMEGEKLRVIGDKLRITFQRVSKIVKRMGLCSRRDQSLVEVAKSRMGGGSDEEAATAAGVCNCRVLQLTREAGFETDKDRWLREKDEALAESKWAFLFQYGRLCSNHGRQTLRSSHRGVTVSASAAQVVWHLIDPDNPTNGRLLWHKDGDLLNNCPENLTLEKPKK